MIAANGNSPPLTYKRFQSILSTLPPPEKPCETLSALAITNVTTPVSHDHNDKYSVPSLDELGEHFDMGHCQDEFMLAFANIIFFNNMNKIIVLKTYAHLLTKLLNLLIFLKIGNMHLLCHKLETLQIDLSQNNFILLKLMPLALLSNKVMARHISLSQFTSC